LNLPPTIAVEADGAFRSALIQGAVGLVQPPSAAQVDAFWRLSVWLLDWNQRMNLTAVREPRDIAVKHILDSMTCLQAYAIPHGGRVLDIGTGAGFPGLVLKVMRPDLRLVLMDSTQKKLAFVDYVVREMGWTDVEVVSGRAEHLAHDSAYREAFDVVVARAVAAMRILAEFCLPYAAVGGAVLAMKGPQLTDELRLADGAISKLGGHVVQTTPFRLPFDGGDRAIAVITKERPTPAAYPRIYRDIKRSPL
jgi:16S rRNA (guanine527-N7)-methyltransferase